MDRLPKVEAILERQAAAWELGRRAVESSRKQAPSQGPWITVSRQLGSGGNELAASLGRELGWQVFDHGILSTIAEHTHTREAVLARLDERAIGPLIDYLSRLFEPELIGQTDYVGEMLRVVWGLAKQGSAIIVGRGANWFLDPRYGLRLRVVAPFEARARRIAQIEDVPIEQARAEVGGNDERQAAFVRKVFGREIDDPLGYDLVVNLGSLSPEEATQAALAGLRRHVASAPVSV